MSGSTQTVVFDFDLTLTRWDTADRFFRWLLKRDAWRMALVIVAAPLLGPLMLFRATRRWPVRYTVWVATLGRSQEMLAALARRHVDEVFEADAGVFLRAGLERLESHLQQGHRVVVATGCLEILARELLDRGGFAHVPLVGSTMRPFLGGMASHRHCFGPRKIPMLTERGFAPPWAVAYTDHECDLPVLELSIGRFLVNPRPKAIRSVEQALAHRPTVLAWE